MLHDFTGVKRPEQAKPWRQGVERWVPGAGAASGLGNFTGRISVLDHEKVLEMDSGDGCTTL